MKAIILAAGMGERLKPLTESIPKALIEIEGVTLIKKSLENLRNIGIKEIFIVVGYLEDLLKKKLGESYKNIKITYVSNTNYSKTGSMFSLSQTEGLIDDTILLIESDLLYEKIALTALVNSPYLNEILVAPLSGSGDEVFICINEKNELSNLGKKISNKDEAIGELVGITKLSLDFIKKLYVRAKEDYKKNEYNYHYEEVIYELSKTYPIKCKLIDKLNWIEIDNENDLKRALEIIYPKILQKEDQNIN